MTSGLAQIDSEFADALAKRKDRLELALIERAFEFGAGCGPGSWRGCICSST